MVYVEEKLPKSNDNTKSSKTNANNTSAEPEEITDKAKNEE